MHLIIWEYSVPEEREGDFRVAYGPDGEWSRLFATAPGFEGVELIALDEPGRYITIDRWVTQEAHGSFMDARSRDYERLDARLAHLTVSEALVGSGSNIDGRQT